MLQSLLRGDVEGAVAKAARLQDIFGRDNLFVELQDHGIARAAAHQPRAARASPGASAPRCWPPTTATTPTGADDEAHDALLCVQTGAVMSDPDRFKFDGDQHYLKTADEMRHLFRDVPEACDNTLWIAERANVEIEFGKPQLPRFPLPEGFADDAAYLQHLTLRGRPAPLGRRAPRRRRRAARLRAAGHRRHGVLPRTSSSCGT